MTETRSSELSASMTGEPRPNLFLVGAPKSGTTALAARLSQHPVVHVAPKELSFFGTDLDFRTSRGRPWHISRDAYLEWFSAHAGKRYLADRSVFYLFSKRAAAEIHDFDPEARIIVMLRDPVDQMHSQHSEMLYQGDEDISDFAKALEAEEQRRTGRLIPTGCKKVFGLLYKELAQYSEQVDRYLTTFGPERVCVLLYDDLVADSRALHGRVLDFLGLEAPDDQEVAVVNSNKELRSVLAMKALQRPSPLVRRVGRAVFRDGQARAEVRRRVQAWNTRIRPRSPVSPELRDSLREEFSEEIGRLERLIGRDLSAWKGEA